MTTFQALIYAIIYGFATFLPISLSGNVFAVSYLLAWSPPPEALGGVIALGTFLAVLIYFRHDWASMISSSLRVVLLFKKPMTLDERMLLFITLSTLPSVGLLIFGTEVILNYSPDHLPLWIGGGMIVFSFPLWVANYLNRRLKSMFDWNWFDGLIIGVAQLVRFIPGAGHQIGMLTGALLRNYHRDAAAKYMFFTLTPWLAYTAYRKLDGVSLLETGPDLTWLTLLVGFVVALLTGLLAIGGFMKNIQKQGFGGYIFYRVIVGAGIITFYFMQ